MTSVPAGTEAEEAAVVVSQAGEQGMTDSSLADTSRALSGSPYESVLLALLEGLRYLSLPLPWVLTIAPSLAWSLALTAQSCPWPRLLTIPWPDC